MDIKIVNELNIEQINAVKQLLQKVHKYDHTFRDPYLSNQFNFFPDMPTFLLAYQNQKLIGMIMIYADEKPNTGVVDLYINVLPDARRQGVATKLLSYAKKILRNYNYTKWEYIAEQNFLDSYPKFLTHNQLSIFDAEYQLSLDLKTFQSAKSYENIFTSELADAEISTVSKMESVIFDNDSIISENYIRSSFLDANIMQYVLHNNNQIIGYCAINVENEYYFFDLFIAEQYQKQGYGTIFMNQILQKLQQIGNKRCVIGVMSDNLPALQLYKDSGFIQDTKILYLTDQTF